MWLTPIYRILNNWRTGMLLLAVATVAFAYFAWRSYNGIIFPLATSPDGKTIVCCELIYQEPSGRVYSPRITIRDSGTGEKLASFATPFQIRPTAVFNNDGSRVAIVDEQRVMIIDLASLSVVDEWLAPEVARVAFERDRNLLLAGVTKQKDRDTKTLWFKKSRDAARIEVGEILINDHVESVIVSQEDQTLRFFLNSESRGCGYVLTSDLDSGRGIGGEKVLPHWMIAASPNGKRAAVMTSIVDLESDENSIPIPAMQSYVFSADSKQLATTDRHGQIYLFDAQGKKTKQAARFDKDPLFLQVLPGEKVVLAATMSGRLQRCDMQEGSVETLVDMKKWFFVFFVPTCILAPCWVVGWVSFGLRDRPGHPFLDMLIFHSAMAILMMECGYLFRPFRQMDDALVMLALSLLGAAFGILIVWTMLCVRRWDWQIPFSAVGIAAVLAVALWASRNMPVRSWEIAVVGTSIFLCTMCSLALFRRNFGRITNTGRLSHDDQEESAQSQISLKQILISISAFALCFAVGRFLHVIPMEAPYYIWLFAYGIVYSAAISGGVWMVFGPYVWWSRIMISCGVMIAIWIGHFAFTQWLRLNLGIIYYVIPLIVNGILLPSLVYCRMHGFALRHSQAQLAE